MAGHVYPEQTDAAHNYPRTGTSSDFLNGYLQEMTSDLATRQADAVINGQPLPAMLHSTRDHDIQQAAYLVNDKNPQGRPEDQFEAVAASLSHLNPAHRSRTLAKPVGGQLVSASDHFRHIAEAADKRIDQMGYRYHATRLPQSAVASLGILNQLRHRRAESNREKALAGRYSAAVLLRHGRQYAGVSGEHHDLWNPKINNHTKAQEISEMRRNGAPGLAASYEEFGTLVPTSKKDRFLSHKMQDHARVVNHELIKAQQLRGATSSRKTTPHLSASVLKTHTKNAEKAHHAEHEADEYTEKILEMASSHKLHATVNKHLDKAQDLRNKIDRSVRKRHLRQTARYQKQLYDDYLTHQWKGTAPARKARRQDARYERQQYDLEETALWKAARAERKAARGQARYENQQRDLAATAAWKAARTQRRQDRKSQPTQQPPVDPPDVGLDIV